MSKPAYPVVQWQIAGTSSSFVKCDGMQLVGFVTGGTLVSTTMTFSMEPAITSAAFIPVKDSTGAAISFTVTTSGYYGFSQDQIAKFTGVEIFKFVGGSSEAAGTTIQPVLIPRQY